MSGKLIRLDLSRKKGNGGSDSGNGGGIEHYSSGLSTDELLAAADQNYFDEGGRNKHDARIRAMMQVLLSKPDTMKEQLRQAAETGGLLNFPSMHLFPLQAEATIFASEDELREFLTKEMAETYLARRREEIKNALATHCTEANKLMRDLTTIANARLSGASPEDILTPEHLRIALATDIVSQTALEHIRDTRQQVQIVITELMKGSENGVKAAPLAQTMQRIGELCQTMTQDLERLSMMAAKATGKDGNSELIVRRTQATAMTHRAREVFAPFIHGNHVITMEQLKGLENFLQEVGTYNKNVGSLIEDGISAIGRAIEAGRHVEAKKIEEFLGFDHQVEGFERMARTLDRNFSTGASILAYTGASNRAMLKSTPPEMLRNAEIESRFPSGFFLKGRDEELVLPSEDDLELG